MQAVAKKTKEPSASDQGKNHKKPSSEEAVVQREINPLWHSMATNTRGHKSAGSSVDPPSIQTKSNHSTFIQRVCTDCEAETQTEALAIQTKLTVGEPGDKYELEADNVADRVMAMPNNVSNRGVPVIASHLAVGSAQRQINTVEDNDKESEEESESQLIQEKSLALGSGVPGIQRMCSECEEKLQRTTEEETPFQAKRTFNALQKVGVEEGDEEGDARLLQTKGTAAVDIQVPTSVEEQIGGLNGSGQPLDPNTRDFMEPRFGHEFSGVRIHTDSHAAGLASVVQARAFTTGNNVVFGAGQYTPNTDAGKHLLAHELTHTIQQGSASGNSPAVQRKPDDLEVGGTYTITTKEGGNLMLRVKPTPAKYLDPTTKSPNTVGNISFGKPVIIKEVRLYDWYVVEAETIEHGKRIGFVHRLHLKSVEAARPEIEGSYDENSQVCDIDGNICLPDEDEPITEFIPDVLYDEENQVCINDENKCYLNDPESSGTQVEELPEQDTQAGSFEISDPEFDALQDGDPVEQLGIVEHDEGTTLWPQADRDKPGLGVLPINTRVFVDRKVGIGWYEVYVEGHQLEGRPSAKALPVNKGTHGYVAAARVNLHQPDPEAWLFRITKSGQGALAIAQELYKDNFSASWGKDYRYLVNVLVAVNEATNRKFLYKENPNDSWEDAKALKGGKIWVPGLALVNALHGQISSGSISYEVLSTLGNIAIGIGAFIVGLLHGAVMSIADLFIGVYDLLKLGKDIVVKIFNQTLMKDTAAFFAELSKIKFSDIVDMVGAKWNDPDIWNRWKFRGYVIGYAIVEILMLYFSAGILTAIKWAGKVGKVGKLASYLSKLPQVQKVIKVAGTLKGKGVTKLKAALKAASALSKAHGWAAKTLRIPLNILRRLSEVDIGKLKKLPQWARERFARLKSEAMLRLLGCHSPCKVDPHAIQTALKLATKAGTKLTSPQDVLNVLKKLDKNFKTSKISRKLRQPDSALMEVIKKAEITDTDFAKLADFLTPGDLTNQAMAYKTFARYLTNMVPVKTGDDIGKFNKVMAAMVKAEPKRGSALKGAMFENWVALHVPTLASRAFQRITFNLKKLLGKTTPPYRRPVDMWVAARGEIWEMKHTFRKVPDAQAKDFAGLVGKTAPDGKLVQKVMYIFPTEDVAKLNKHLADTYKFGVYYIDEVTNTMKQLY